jgi:hypothetical protein
MPLVFSGISNKGIRVIVLRSVKMANIYFMQATIS